MNFEHNLNSVEVTIDELLYAIDEVHKLPVEQRTRVGRSHLMAKIFQGQLHKALSVESRLIAMGEMIETGKLPGWALPEKEDGSYRIAESVWQATATEPLNFVDAQPHFNVTEFLNKVLSYSIPEGNA